MSTEEFRDDLRELLGRYPSLDAEDLREFVERAEAGEFGADPGLQATVRIARVMLDGQDTDEGGTDT